MAAKYKKGDRVKVKTNGAYKVGTVSNVTGDLFHGYKCMVDFDCPPILIPQNMNIEEHYLESYRNNIWRTPSSHCPICGERWHEMEHPIHGKKQKWYDCLKCKKTKEEILKETDK